MSSPYSRMGGMGGGYGSSMYGGMGGGYGGMGGMGGGYGMGGMGGGYGMGGMGGGYGMGGMNGQDPNSLTNSFSQSTQATFHVIESIVGAFGGFAQMLESTYMATHSSFFGKSHFSHFVRGTGRESAGNDSAANLEPHGYSRAVNQALSGAVVQAKLHPFSLG